MSAQPNGFQDKVAFIWKVADTLRGHFKQHEYGSVMLPLLVLRRMDAVLTPTREKVRQVAASFGAKQRGPGEELLLRSTAGVPFYNLSPLDFRGILADPNNVAENLWAYVNGLSPEAFEIIDRYDFAPKVTRMQAGGILYQVLSDFADLKIDPGSVPNETMGLIFEELLRKFSEMSNETAGEHYTPREVVRLVVDLLLSGEAADEIEGKTKPVRTVFDPAAGSGGMLSAAIDRITELNATAIVQVYGQELNPETWAIARSDLFFKGVDQRSEVVLGNSLTQDAFPGQKFDYMLANPPYGVDWKSYAKPIQAEAANEGFAGRFGAGLPRVSDGSLLFLQHMLSKMKSGSRIGIVLSGSPLFSGGAGSGESEIRRWILESDWLEGIVALPDQMFYNTGISTYVWVLTNAKPAHRAGKVALVDGRELFAKMRKSLGDKRKYLPDEAIATIVELYQDLPDDPRVKVVPNEAFGFQRVTVERPQRSGDDEDAPVVMVKGKPVADASLRDSENIPLPAGYLEMSDEQKTKALVEQAEEHLRTEIHPYVPDAWLDHAKTKVGYEIPFTRQFYVYTAPRPVEEIAGEIRGLEVQIQEWMKGLGL